MKVNLHVEFDNVDELRAFLIGGTERGATFTAPALAAVPAANDAPAATEVKRGRKAKAETPPAQTPTEPKGPYYWIHPESDSCGVVETLAEADEMVARDGNVDIVDLAVYTAFAERLAAEKQAAEKQAAEKQAAEKQAEPEKQAAPAFDAEAEKVALRALAAQVKDKSQVKAALDAVGATAVSLVKPEKMSDFRVRLETLIKEQD